MGDPNELQAALADIAGAVRIIDDFPQPGIAFRDITPLLADPGRFALAQRLLAQRANEMAPDAVVAVEARGFLLGAPIALALGLPLVPVRKPGKLPGRTISINYGLEYGQDQLQLHLDAVTVGQRVLIVDDLLATGGTAAAAASLVRQAGARVAGALFLVELRDLPGRARLETSGVAVQALLQL